MKWTKCGMLLLCALLALGGCQAETGTTAPTGTSQTEADSQAETAETAAAVQTAWFSDRDLDGTYDAASAVTIRLEGDQISSSSDSVVFENGQILLRQEGVYLVSGTLNDGQIVVDAGETDKVQIVLAGVDLTCADSAALYAKEADKVFLTLAEGTENYLRNGGAYAAIDDNNFDAVVFAKTDLTCNGAGSLTVEAAAGHGIVSKDALVVTQGSYRITAEKQALSGKDSIAIADGSFQLESGTDAIHAENTDDETLGTIAIAGGSFAIAAQGDGISAGGALEIAGGDFTITTGEGSASVTMETAEDMGPGRWGGADTAAETEDPVSRKGIKAEGTYTIRGGVFTLDTVDDCLHAGGEMTIEAGTFTLSSGDDAVHCDSALTIRAGTFTIPYCYEGIEGLSITIDDGTYDITSQDDGLNAAGGADSSGFGGFMGRDQFETNEAIFITINGGAITVVSGGDSLDSNGDLTINGGTLHLTCNGAGDTALDCDGTYANNGGDVTTNDGSESNPGGMPGGGRGNRGDMGEMPEPPEGEMPELPEGEMPEPPSDRPEGGRGPMEPGASETPPEQADAL